MDIGQRSTSRRQPLAQINVTPFVDVMLVLLIIFMITAPMLDQGIEVNLPEVANAPNLSNPAEPLTVKVDRSGKIWLGKEHIASVTKLTAVLRQAIAGDQGREVFLEADRAVAYGEVVKVMAATRAAGIEKLGMVAQPPEK
ncbi:MAG: protein TolR [Desulfuromonadales bacterium]|nr:protein TolR [Desulfuromonadales bacterium]MDT8422261.1 protein TolR [Desulfuromonadales bacterium]